MRSTCCYLSVCTNPFVLLRSAMIFILLLPTVCISESDEKCQNIGKKYARSAVLVIAKLFVGVMVLSSFSNAAHSRYPISTRNFMDADQ